MAKDKHITFIKEKKIWNVAPEYYTLSVEEVKNSDNPLPLNGKIRIHFIFLGRAICVELPGGINGWEMRDVYKEEEIAEEAVRNFLKNCEVSTLEQIALLAMSGIAEFSEKDAEVGHIRADSVLKEVLSFLGLKDLVDMYNKVEKYYA